MSKYSSGTSFFVSVGRSALAPPPTKRNGNSPVISSVVVRISRERTANRCRRVGDARTYNNNIMKHNVTELSLCHCEERSDVAISRKGTRTKRNGTFIFSAVALRYAAVRGRTALPPATSTNKVEKGCDRNVIGRLLCASRRIPAFSSKSGENSPKNA